MRGALQESPMLLDTSTKRKPMGPEEELETGFGFPSGFCSLRLGTRDFRCSWVDFEMPRLPLASMRFNECLVVYCYLRGPLHVHYSSFSHLVHIYFLLFFKFTKLKIFFTLNTSSTDIPIPQKPFIPCPSLFEKHSFPSYPGEEETRGRREGLGEGKGCEK